MKAEVLAEWRTRLADRTLITLPAGAVERLLDERLKLLDAVRDAAHAFATTHRCSTHLEVAKTALAFAEEL